MSEALEPNHVSWLRMVARIWMDDRGRDSLTADELKDMLFKKFGVRVSRSTVVSAVQGTTYDHVEREPVPDWPLSGGQRLLTDEEVAWLRRYCYRKMFIEEKKPLPMKKLAMAFYLQRFRKEGQPERPQGAPFVSGQSLKAAILGETYKDAPAYWMCLPKWPHVSRSRR